MQSMKRTTHILLLAAWCLVAACAESDIYSDSETPSEAQIDGDALTLDGKTECAELPLSANLWWKARIEYDGGDEWLTLSPTEGFGSATLRLESDRNYDLENPRTARIVIESDDAEATFRREFAVTQQPSALYVEVAGVEEQQLLTAVTPSVTELTLFTNDAWEAESSDESWCRVESDGNDPGRQTVRLLCAGNTTKRERSAEVTLRTKRSAEAAYRFRVTQSGVFASPVLELSKDEQGRIALSWDEVMGAVKYELTVRDGERVVARIDNGTQTACDLSAAEVFAAPLYVGAFEVTVRALSDDPEIWSESKPQGSNSHFAAGRGTADDPFVVDRDSYLRNIARVNAVAAGSHYRLDYTPAPGDDFEPLCSPEEPFAGFFDGNGKVIAGWEARPMADSRNYFGFFGGIAEGAEVRSLVFERCTLWIGNEGSPADKAGNGFAWLAASNAGTVRDVRVVDCTVGCETGTSPLNVAGIAANNEGRIADCRVSGAFSAAADRNKNDEFVCGGIAAWNYGTVERCVNDASVTAMDKVGGVVGMNGGRVADSGNNGAVTANYYFGGVVGYTTSSSAACTIDRCYNTGTLTMDEPAGMGRGAAYMGGITSRIYSAKTVISQCRNEGALVVGPSVSGSNMRVGGIVGHTNKPGRLVDCYNAGDATIRGKVNYGGIVGEMADQAVEVSRCYSVGKATADDGAAGNIRLAFGKASGKALISDCYALDQGGEFAGGSTSGISGGGLLDRARMADPASYAGWDFTTVWRAGSGDYPYPMLR